MTKTSKDTSSVARQRLATMSSVLTVAPADQPTMTRTSRAIGWVDHPEDLLPE
jgi:hypothetical protein